MLYIVAFYAVYSFIRNAGTGALHVEQAFHHAQGVIRIERLLGSYHEESIQDWFLGTRWFIKAWNIYYGSFHFIVTAAALVWCFRKRPDRYPRWRNTLACTTGLALIGFAFFPLMPPRLLPASYGFVDTLAKVGGLWSFDSGTMKAVSNQYAAMPSLHFGWSSWCLFVLWPATEGRRWARALLVAYPLATLFAVVVTANHFWLDAAGGAAVLGAGYAIASALTGRSTPRFGTSRPPLAAGSG
ncbi:MAG TPA: phosphatase PAP2 family protein [Acidimicrobiales bacterium]|nr:phosphatase PAP2 family protein [Acidimicrobiales bacterium]